MIIYLIRKDKINSEIYASKYLEDKNDEYLDLDNNLSEDEYEMLEKLMEIQNENK